MFTATAKVRNVLDAGGSADLGGMTRQQAADMTVSKFLRQGGVLFLPESGERVEFADGRFVRTRTAQLRLTAGIDNDSLTGLLGDGDPLLAYLSDKFGFDAADLTERAKTLTPRETEVFRLMGTGMSNRDIAVVLGISPKTLDIHRAKVMEKLDVGHANNIGRLFACYALANGMPVRDAAYRPGSSKAG